MEWHALGRWPAGFSARTRGTAIAALLSLSLVSFDRFDPTFSSLVSPSGGIRNALGLPGALIGGTLVEWLGLAGLLVPLLILNWSWNRQGRPRLSGYCLYGFALIWIAATLRGLAATDLALGWSSPGLIGWAGAGWVRESTGPAGGTVLLIALAALTLPRLAYRIDWNRRLAEGWSFARFGWGGFAARLEGGAIGIVHGFVRLSHGLEGGTSGLADAGSAALRTAGRKALRVLSFPLRIRLPAARSIRFQRAASSGRHAAPPFHPATPFNPALVPGGGDPFDSWFREVGAEAAVVPPPAQSDPVLAPPAAEPLPAAPDWDKQFRAYSDNLDLDWEDRVLKVRRARQALFDNDQDEQDPKSKSG
jgi:hypothetical protein